MPEMEIIKRANADALQGKAPSTQSGEFVREEIEHIRQGKHGARSAKQVIAIGLSKARRAGVKLPLPAKGKVSVRVRQQAMRDSAKGRVESRQRPSQTRSRGVIKALRREGAGAASHLALSRHAHASARKRGKAALHRAALQAVRTKGSAGLRRAARKAARTRTGNSKTS
jgi:uncharacterized protein DUF6496